jgi:hypothetical protein
MGVIEFADKGVFVQACSDEHRCLHPFITRVYPLVIDDTDAHGARVSPQIPLRVNELLTIATRLVRMGKCTGSIAKLSHALQN